MLRTSKLSPMRKELEEPTSVERERERLPTKIMLKGRRRRQDKKF